VKKALPVAKTILLQGAFPVIIGRARILAPP
jgi:hypothetical protein